MRPTVLLLAFLVLAGCLDEARRGPALLEPVEREAETREPGEYWLVRVAGAETRSRLPGEGFAVCSLVLDHDADETTRTFRHANASAPPATSVRAVVAAGVFDEGDCPVLYRHAFGDAAAWSGRFGTLDIAVEDDGTVVVDGARVPQGSRWRAPYESRDGRTTYEGELSVENLGAWPQARIARAE